MEIAAVASEKKLEKKMRFPLINVPELEKELTFFVWASDWKVWNLTAEKAVMGICWMED